MIATAMVEEMERGRGGQRFVPMLPDGDRPTAPEATARQIHAAIVRLMVQRGGRRAA